MKKLLLIVALLTISLTLTFGQAAVSGWGRGIFVPFMIADGDPSAASLVSWGPGGTRMGFTISGSSANVGVQLDVLLDHTNTVDQGGTQWAYPVLAFGDQQKIWVKPIEMLTISVGRIYDATLRGNAGFVANNWYRYDLGQDIAGDDYVFGQVGTLAEADPVNFEVAVAPVDGAYLYLAFGGNGGIDLQNIWGFGPITLEDMFKTGQYGGGYDIAGIGVIRAQYFGRGDYGIINAAFKLTMVEGLMIDIGGWIPTDSEMADTLANIALYGTYTMDTLVLHLAADITLDDDDGVDAAYRAGLGVEYGLEGGLTVQGDVRYDSSEKFAIGAFAKWSYSNGIFGVGVQATNATFKTWGAPVIDKTDPDAFVIAIPIRLEYWF